MCCVFLCTGMESAWNDSELCVCCVFGCVESVLHHNKLCVCVMVQDVHCVIESSVCVSLLV